MHAALYNPLPSYNAFLLSLHLPNLLAGAERRFDVLKLDGSRHFCVSNVATGFCIVASAAEVQGADGAAQRKTEMGHELLSIVGGLHTDAAIVVSRAGCCGYLAICQIRRLIPATPT